MDSLSDIFAGKALGVNTLSSMKDSAKPKGFGDFDFKGKTSDIEKKVFSNTKSGFNQNISKPQGFGNFDFKGKTLDIEKKLFGNLPSYIFPKFI